MITNHTKPREYTAEEIEHIVLMAWADTVPFESIKREWGLTQNEVVKFMRQHQSPSTYIRWRKRVENRTGDRSKHEKISRVTSCRQKF